MQIYVYIPSEKLARKGFIFKVRAYVFVRASSYVPAFPGMVITQDPFVNFSVRNIS